MRAPCRVCRADHAVTRRGAVWSHSARPLSCPCPGARLPPLGSPSDAEPVPLPGQGIARSPLAREHRDPGTVYLVCFDSPFGHARHYLGWAGPGHLDQRLAHHAAGSGANLLRHVVKAGISWRLVRTWPGDRTEERRLKRRGGHTRLCPACRPELVPILLRHTDPPGVAPPGSVCA